VRLAFFEYPPQYRASKQVEMRAQPIALFVFGLFLLTLGNGCVTHELWKNDNLEAWNQPATNPNLRLFTTSQKDDLLVVYDEYSERNDKTHPRAYWLKENQNIIDQRKFPHFISTNTFGFAAVPVFSTGTDPINLPLYAVVATNGQSFTLHLDNGSTESHDLPFYNDQKGKVEKFALTPLATAADVTIVGGVFGYFFLEGMAQSGASYSWKP
jgi:hypothetical protein